MRTISVTPLDSGWIVQHGHDAALVFRAGSGAEAAARRLARAFSDAGESAEVMIYLRDGSLAGRILSGPGPLCDVRLAG
jgi:hypothetical protein